MEERKEAKLKMESTRSERLKQGRIEEHKAENKEVKRSARENKIKWMEEIAEAAEKAAEIGRSKELNSITKTGNGRDKRQV